MPGTQAGSLHSGFHEQTPWFCILPSLSSTSTASCNSAAARSSKTDDGGPSPLTQRPSPSLTAPSLPITTSVATATAGAMPATPTGGQGAPSDRPDEGPVSSPSHRWSDYHESPLSGAGPSTGSSTQGTPMATPHVRPAPAVVDTSSHVERHVLPRRFLGPMPQSVAYNEQTLERRRRVREVRRAAVAKLLRHERERESKEARAARGRERELERGMEMEDGHRRHRFHVRRRDRLNKAHEFEVDINESDTDTSSSSDESTASWLSRKKEVKPKKDKDKKKKKKKKKKDKGLKPKGKKKKKDKTYKVWVGGEGFDIGREFKTTEGEEAPDAAVAGKHDDSNAPDTVDDAVDMLHDQEEEEGVDENEYLKPAEPVGDSPGSFVPALDSADSYVTAPSTVSKAKAKGKQRADDASFVTARTTQKATPAATPATQSGPSTVDTPSTETPRASDTPSTLDTLRQKHEGDVDDIPKEPTPDDVSHIAVRGASPPSPRLSPHHTPARSPSPVGSDHKIPAMALGLQRPTSTRSTTTDTFRTADDYHTPEGSVHEGHHGHGHDAQHSDTESFLPAPSGRHPDIRPSPGVSECDNNSPRGGGGSERHLLGTSDDEAYEAQEKLRRTRGSISSTAGSLRNRAQRLKSALRPPTAAKREKTVTWNPVNSAISPPPERADGHLPTIVQSPSSVGDSQSTRPPKSPSEPADPIAVLRRSGAEIANTSTEAQEDATVIDVDDFMPGGIVMRDRVLVKVGRHREDRIPRFDEAYQRRDPCYRLDPSEEYIVGMTMTSVDFYVDWRFRCQEHFKGFKRLRYTVPLAPPTTLSVFNSRDMMLALMCPWAVVMRHTVRHQGSERSDTTMWDRFRNSSTLETLGMERSGLGVFLMKFSERTRALDWHWYISEQLGYRLPRQIDVRVPSMGQTVRVAIPEEAASATVSRESTIKLLWSLLLSSSSQLAVLRELGTVPRIELAWKGPDATLDWVAYDKTISGRNREWALLASFAQASQEGHHATLMARTASHRGTRIRLEDKTLLEEPPGVEGYLMWRQQASKELVYVSTNEGVMFIAPAASAIPPLLPKRAGSTPADLFPDVLKDFFNSEHRRMSQFIEKCTGIIDLRDIVEVKLRVPQDPGILARAGPATPSTHPSDPSTPATQLSQGSGAHHLSMRTIVPKEGTKKGRELRVTLRGGTVITFEAHTPAVAAEWASHLHELVRYWSRFHRVTAREEMDTVALNACGDPQINYYYDPHADEMLDNIWNWCVIEGCRTVTMCGRLFVKRGKYTKFKAVYMTITGGSIVTFRLKTSAGLQPRRHVWPLFGAYIYSGMLAQEELRESVNETAFSPSARMYQDGLRSTDGAEDTTFCVRITWPAGRFAAPQPWNQAVGDDDKFVPPVLSQDPYQLLVCRARSKLERDRWIWALNAEKERCTRAHLAAGERLRNWGNLPRFRTLLHTNGTADSRPAFGERLSSSSDRSW